MSGDLRERLAQAYRARHSGAIDFDTLAASRTDAALAVVADNGAPRLTAAFSEWLMCLPAGHVTAHLDRRDSLRAIGNGVCPPQAAVAWLLLTGQVSPLDMSLGQSVPSADMTTDTDIPRAAAIAARKDDMAAARRRVIESTGAIEQAQRIGAAASAEIVRTAMMELAAIWREQAAAWDNSGRRGAKGNSTRLTQAAAELAGFAVGLAEPAAPAPQPEPEPVSLLDQMLPAVEAPHHNGDAPMQPSPFSAPAAVVEQASIPALPVESPFATPAAPGRNRPDVKRLSFAELPKLIADTYPTAREHLSHSYVEDLSSCGLKALLSDASRREQIGPRRPSWSLVGGIAFHNTVEAIERAAINMGGADPVGEIGPVADLWNNFLTEAIDDQTLALADTPYADPATWHVANKGLENLDWWRVKGAEMIELYLTRHNDAWRQSHTLLTVPVLSRAYGPVQTTPVLEFAFSATAGNTSIISEGRIDAAWVAYPHPSQPSQYPTATLEIIDYKSGARADQASPFQLAQYADVLRRHYLPVNFALPVVGRYYQARKGIYSDPVKLDPMRSAEEIDFRFTQADRAMKAGVFLPNPSSFCAGCGLVDYCPTQSKRDAS